MSTPEGVTGSAVCRCPRGCTLLPPAARVTRRLTVPWSPKCCGATGSLLRPPTGLSPVYLHLACALVFASGGLSTPMGVTGRASPALPGGRSVAPLAERVNRWRLVPTSPWFGGGESLGARLPGPFRPGPPTSGRAAAHAFSGGALSCFGVLQENISSESPVPMSQMRITL